jgi:ubiquinone/menaquinone biosynthesis C-methylase UbiE
MKLDLACGRNKTPGFIGVDCVEMEGVDLVMDLEQFPWNIESNSVDEIVCNHYIEHTSDLIAFIDEIYRILKLGGVCKIVAPFYTSIGCWQDPTHKRAINQATFLYFNKNFREVNRLDHYNIKSNFDYNYKFNLFYNWENKSEEEIDFAIIYYNNVVNTIDIILTKIE